MSPRSRSLLLLCLFALCSATIDPANAVVCSPLVDHTRYVGDIASDSQCTDNDIQSAIDNTTCPNTRIVITKEHTYTAQHLTINDKSLTLFGVGDGVRCGGVGGTGIASATPQTGLPVIPQVVISGAGHSGAPVLSIRGNSHVTLQLMEIIGASNDANNGGGVSFNGFGQLTLDTTTIDKNSALFGGGILFNGTGGPATLTIGNRVSIDHNTAVDSGGGVFLRGSAEMDMVGDFSTMNFNTAGAAGGGLAVTDVAVAYIGSPGIVPFAGAISDNAANVGGGIAVIGSSVGSSTVYLFSVDATRPVLISQNTAVKGGGIYVHAQDEGFFPAVCAYDFRIDANSATDGAAIYSDADGTFDNSFVAMNVDPSFFTCAKSNIVRFNAQSCIPGSPCNEINYNSSPSGAILRTADTAFRADRMQLRGNSGNRMLTMDNGFYYAFGFSNCLIADNHSAHELVETTLSRADDIGGFTKLVFDSCTIAQNTIDNGSYVFFAKFGLSVLRSIVFQPGRQTFDYQSAGCADDCLKAQYVVSNDTATFPTDALGVVLLTDPLFVNTTNTDIDKHDYHLRAFRQSGVITSSRAMDFAPPINGDDRDLDGNAHDQDVTAVPNIFGIRDVGAFEAQPIPDRVFADSLGDPVSLLR